jgi:hypothetical protein
MKDKISVVKGILVINLSQVQGMDFQKKPYIVVGIWMSAKSRFYGCKKEVQPPGRTLIFCQEMVRHISRGFFMMRVFSRGYTYGRNLGKVLGWE